MNINHFPGKDFHNSLAILLRSQRNFVGKFDILPTLTRLVPRVLGKETALTLAQTQNY